MKFQRETVLLTLLICSSLWWLHDATLAAYGQDVCEKKIKLLQSYRTDGRCLGGVALAPDGSIWIGTTQGKLLHLDPKLSTKPLKEIKLSDGILHALLSLNGSIVVGTSDGVHVFDSAGQSRMSVSNLGSTIDQPPVFYSGDLLFVADDGLPFQLGKNLSEFSKLSRQTPPGVITNAPILMQKPRPTLIYGTKAIGNFVTGEYQYQLTMADLTTGTLKSFDLPDKVIFKATVISSHGFETALLVTKSGKILKTNPDGPEGGTVLDMKCLAAGPVLELDGRRLAVFGFDLKKRILNRFIFTMSGLESACPVQRSNGVVVHSEPSSEPTVFLDELGRTNVLMGFADHSLRLIDAQTGIIQSEFKTDGVVTCKPVRLNKTDFFVTEDSIPEPHESTKHYLVRVVTAADK